MKILFKFMYHILEIPGQRLNLPHWNKELSILTGLTMGGIIKALNTGRLNGQKIGREWHIPAEEALRFITRST